MVSPDIKGKKEYQDPSDMVLVFSFGDLKSGSFKEVTTTEGFKKLRNSSVTKNLQIQQATAPSSTTASKKRQPQAPSPFHVFTDSTTSPALRHTKRQRERSCSSSSTKKPSTTTSSHKKHTNVISDFCSPEFAQKHTSTKAPSCFDTSNNVAAAKAIYSRKPKLISQKPSSPCPTTTTTSSSSSTKKNTHTKPSTTGLRASSAHHNSSSSSNRRDSQKQPAGYSPVGNYSSSASSSRLTSGNKENMNPRYEHRQRRNSATGAVGSGGSGRRALMNAAGKGSEGVKRRWSARRPSQDSQQRESGGIGVKSRAFHQVTNLGVREVTSPTEEIKEEIGVVEETEEGGKENEIENLRAEVAQLKGLIWKLVGSEAQGMGLKP
mmetsp:Transcript_17972/g.20402  ORF Transcript_17972/g.20402 Transcript_17972/m.20402 type:complete len:378 (-) Transcript_17972:181-1314(-)